MDLPENIDHRLLYQDEHVYDSDCSASLHCIPSIVNEVAKDGF